MISEKYKDLYLSTSEEGLKKLSDFLLYLEKKPQNQNLIENIFRLIHSMKGAAATMGYKKTVNLFHAMENVVDAAYSQDLEINKKIINLFFVTVDILKKNFKSIEKNNKEINLAKNTKDFNSILKRKAKKISKKAKSKKEKHILGTLPTVAEISVSSDKLDKIQNSLDDLLISSMQARVRIQETGDSKLLATYVETDKILGNMRRDLEKIRIVPLRQVFSALPYLVREVARDEDKEVELIINDNGLSLDKAVLDELVEILIQLLKNAVSHGIKPEQSKGRVELGVSLVQDSIKVVVEDNGQGIDWQDILSMAVKNKIVSRQQAKKLTIEEVKNLIFTAGISKGKILTTSSGRGVGLSLVKAKVKDLNGRIEIDSVLGKGTSFTIHLPLPLSVFRSVIFKLGTFELAIPLSYVEEVVKLDEVKDLSKAKTFSSKKVRFNLIFLEKIFDLSEFNALSKYVILLKYNKQKLAIPISSNIQEGELIMKKTPRILQGKEHIKGVAIFAAGQPVLVLDINNMS
ncbi:Hpt domain-containing protein [bacterium]|nr:Hpt domain-containing protein [bacterium]